jgi:hypothetical protein
MKVAITKATDVSLDLIAENKEDKALLTTLWERLVLGSCHMEPGTQTVDVLTVRLHVRDLHSDSQEIRR